jgi:hypothetical protein
MTNPNLGGAEILSPHPLYSSSLLSFYYAFCPLKKRRGVKGKEKSERGEKREQGMKRWSRVRMAKSKEGRPWLAATSE